ncbi:hypothetical protein LSH36_600g01034 [Paralvinella palmiformis]|uniref:Uncharacterized protein n=1 Tax=Paralvinella palmiformis TaxID=53620 RepID=A0AAD9J513_9ANNE|nr:hypothetical protein LSH36_600g01034 [Paralvinella palmiformis]
MDGLHGTLEDIMRTLDTPTYNENTFHKHNRYSDNIRYSDTDEEDDDEENDEIIRSMFSRHAESSSEDDDSDGYYGDDQLDEDSEGVHFRGVRLSTADDGVEDVGECDLEELPNWFMCQPFQYSKLMVLPLLAGAPMALFMGGEMRSSWYAILLAAAVGYIALTGSWILLLMKDFCRSDPHLALYLESMLFMVYPSLSIILFTWTISMWIGHQFSPYVLLVMGFLFYRIFVKPFSSSFVDDQSASEEKKIIIDGWCSSGLAFLLTIAPSVLYLTISWYHVITYTALIPILMNVLTVLAVSVFVTTFLHLKPILDVFDDEITMQHVKKLLWQCALLSVALQMTSLLVTMEMVYFLDSRSWLPFAFHICGLFILTTLFVYIVVMERDQLIDTPKFIKYILCIMFLSLLCICQQSDLLTSISLYEKSSHILLGLGLASVITSVAALKLSVYHRSPNNITWKVGPLLLVTGLTLVTVQPNVTADMFDVVRLLLFQSVFSGCLLVALIHRIKSYTSLYLLCLLTGSSLGAVIYSMVFSGLSTTGWINVWSLSVILLSVIMFLIDLLSDNSMSGLDRTCAAAGLLIVAMAAKFHSITQLPQLSKDASHQSYLLMAGNISVVICLLTLLSLTEHINMPSDLWMLATTGVLFLLQKDEKVPVLNRLNQENHIVPSAATVVALLFGLIVYQSPLLQPHSSFLTGLCATIEMVVLLLSLPVFVVLGIVLWFGDFHTLPWYKSSSQAMSVLYLTPFFFCLILTPVSTTYQSWIYAALGITAGTYLWQTKIPLSIL